MKGADSKEIIGWCVHCKDEIYEAEKHVIDENGDMLHKHCDNLISNDELNFSEE